MLISKMLIRRQNKLSKKRFTSWLSIYGIFYKHKVIEGKTNNRRWIEFENKMEEKIIPSDDIWDDPKLQGIL